jgi:hypothetical protein
MIVMVDNLLSKWSRRAILNLIGRLSGDLAKKIHFILVSHTDDNRANANTSNTTNFSLRIFDGA